MSIVRHNLMNEPGYTGYCGGGKRCSMPRTRWNGHQFQCPECGWVSQFDAEFLAAYRAKWGIPEPTSPAPEVIVDEDGAHYVKKPALRPYQQSAFSSSIRSTSARMALAVAAMSASIVAAGNVTVTPGAVKTYQLRPSDIGTRRERTKAQWKRETRGFRR